MGLVRDISEKGFSSPTSFIQSSCFLDGSKWIHSNFMVELHFCRPRLPRTFSCRFKKVRILCAPVEGMILENLISANLSGYIRCWRAYSKFNVAQLFTRDNHAAKPNKDFEG
ncbi:uncharacterized protein [Henckelia pumila]|uniref:uncharacterized protein n=1 Tax=Henckelia pumila TaxID=405737 RepID=UPI003C6E277F